MASASIYKLEPHDQVTFNYVPRKYLASQLHLTNVSENPIAFKIKTNVPVCYLVKPHNGVLPPKHSIWIEITMQPTEYNPQNAAIKDKFQVNVIPIPPSINLSSLTDQVAFQQLWDSVPKSLNQSSLLKVFLKFVESSFQERSTQPESTKEISSPGLEDSQKLSTSIDPRTSPGGRSGSKDEGNNTSLLMQSFTSDTMINNQKLAQSQVLPSDLIGEQNLTKSVLGTKSVVEEREKEKEKREEKKEERKEEISVVKEERPLVKEEKPLVREAEVSNNLEKSSALTASQSTSINQKETRKDPEVIVNKSVNKASEDRIGELEKKLEELTNEKKALTQRCTDALARSDEMKKLLINLSEENERLKAELSNLKTTTFKEKPAKKDSTNDMGGFQLSHTLIVAIVALILGAFLGSN